MAKNDYYTVANSIKRIENRAARLKRLLELKAPDIIVNNERKMLAEGIDTLWTSLQTTKPTEEEMAEYYQEKKKPVEPLTDDEAMLFGISSDEQKELNEKIVDINAKKREH